MAADRLKGIEVFVCTADAGSFTVAAQRLNLTTSAVSKGIARLESRLNVRLFERTTRTLALTEAGTAFHRTCTQILADMEEAEVGLAARQREPVGRLRVDVPITFGRLQVLPVLLQLSQRHPAVRPHLSFTDRFVDVIEEGIDVAVRIAAVDTWPATLGHRLLGHEQLIFCAAPAYLAAHGRPNSLAELHQHARIVYGRADGSISPWRYGAGEEGSAPSGLDNRLVLGSGEALVSALVGGFGVAQVATWLVREQLARGELVELLPGQAVDGLALNLVWPRSRQGLAKVQVLLDALGETLAIR